MGQMSMPRTKGEDFLYVEYFVLRSFQNMVTVTLIFTSTKKHVVEVLLLGSINTKLNSIRIQGSYLCIYPASA